MATLVISLYIDAFFKSSFKFDFRCPGPSWLDSEFAGPAQQQRSRTAELFARRVGVLDEREASEAKNLPLLPSFRLL
jgi:hypothetical protein